MTKWFAVSFAENQLTSHSDHVSIQCCVPGALFVNEFALGIARTAERRLKVDAKSIIVSQCKIAIADLLSNSTREKLNGASYATRV